MYVPKIVHAFFLSKWFYSFKASTFFIGSYAVLIGPVATTSFCNAIHLIFNFCLSLVPSPMFLFLNIAILEKKQAIFELTCSSFLSGWRH